MGFDYSGMSFQEKVAEEGIPPTAVFGFSLLVVFLLLAAQYESWTLPFGVLLGTPIAVLGALGALWLGRTPNGSVRSEEHTSELQSQSNLVCRLLLAKKT